MIYTLQNKERYKVSQILFRSKIGKGTKVGIYILKIAKYLNTHIALDCGLSEDLGIDLILQSLPSSFDQFVNDRVEKGETKTLQQVLELLETYEMDMEMSKALRIVEANSSANQDAHKMEGIIERKDVSPHCGNP
ncbi:uncharacterized protein LOC116140738 [Pistacia vera]|uniref:uncharacterized protein LOC116140738 n=1 Tax=Pistacia vera TaxID=55513 RepID=UPI001263D318|nr:uncharacterized protein LOC116140738 [Pistacia vera]